MNKDQVRGRVEEAKGKVKEFAGKIVDDDDMEWELLIALAQTFRLSQLEKNHD